jgi:hypothetical protein
MKIKAFASILALFLLCLTAPQVVNAQSASGNYQFSFEDKYTKQLEFDARKNADGSTSGHMFFSDEAKIAILDVDGTGEKEFTYPGFYIKVDLDDLVIDKNQAAMSGTVRDSSVSEFIGQRVLLTVEDNGDNTRVPDKLTWGIYQPVVRNWIPSDAELKDDPGVGMRWLATDAERRDDKGYMMPRDESIGTQSFPISSYVFVDVAGAAGDIIVRA